MKKNIIIIVLCILVSVLICYVIGGFMFIKMQQNEFDEIDRKIKSGEMQIYPDKKVDEDNNEGDIYE